MLQFVKRRAALEVILKRGFGPSEVVGVNARFPFREGIWHLAVLVAEHLLPARREIDLVALDVPIPNPVARSLHRKIEAGALAERFLLRLTTLLNFPAKLLVDLFHVLECGNEHVEQMITIDAQCVGLAAKADEAMIVGTRGAARPAVEQPAHAGERLVALAQQPDEAVGPGFEGVQNARRIDLRRMGADHDFGETRLSFDAPAEIETSRAEEKTEGK